MIRSDIRICKYPAAMPVCAVALNHSCLTSRKINVSSQARLCSAARQCRGKVSFAAIAPSTSTGSEGRLAEEPGTSIPCRSESSRNLIDDEAPCHSGRGDAGRVLRRAALAAVAAGGVFAPAAASLAAEAAPQAFLEFVLQAVEQSGPLGPVALALAMALCECIPLFPTQPLSLASGLLFGSQDGACVIVVGTTLAAMIAFSLARGIGRPLAERLVRAEMSGHGDVGPGPIRARLMAVEGVIEQGTFWQQTLSIFLLRLTPLLPYSACNYVLGLSPLKAGPYFLGTLAGMICWAPLYASIGGASRSLLLRGANPSALVADVMERASSLTKEVAGTAAVVAAAAAVALLVYCAGKLRDGQREEEKAVEGPMQRELAKESSEI